MSWDYGAYTWHTNRDTYDKIVPEDLKRNATLTAMLVYLDNVRNYAGEAPYAGAKVVLGIALFLVTATIVVVRQRDSGTQPSGRSWLYVAAYGIACAIALTLGFLGGAILYGFQEVGR